ncbi:uncharacterized protein LOC117179075 [Belonocnema kinseyi]|uniref:uncharacterized protein LOC117179075 n=1 Tax=Belonocnema kinseyi TaxID=2817044 RepID=UPI00143CC8DD|nr:uncharacterized protein LOC117179075 [Belonocnema kinseyi]
MNNQMVEIYYSKNHQMYQLYVSTKDDTEFGKSLSNEDQQKQIQQKHNQRVSLMKKFNNNCVSKSLNLQFTNKDLIQLYDLNDQCFISIPKWLENDNKEKALQVCERWSRMGEESSGLSSKLNNESNDSNMNRNFQNCRKLFLQEANCTVEINNDLHRVGNIISPTVYLCPVYTICTFLVIIAIIIIYLFYIVIIYPG